MIFALYGENGYTSDLFLTIDDKAAGRRAAAALLQSRVPGDRPPWMVASVC